MSRGVVRGAAERGTIRGAEVAFVAVALATLAVAPPARAYDAATTHAGLTQQAVVASALHAVLARRLGRADGLFQSLALHAELLPVNQRRLLQAKLGALDPAGGYRPSDDGVAPALAWAMAGSVLELTPPERIQNHFFDPSTGQGLRDDAQPDAFFHALRMMFDGSNGVRGVATGTSFSFEGRSSLDWLMAPENEQGLPVFQAQLEAAVASERPDQRSLALARSLMALGGVLTVLEDAGNPAQVRNDFRAAYLGTKGSGVLDESSAFEREVADWFGISGVPAARRVVRRPTWKDYFHSSDGQGLADRTQRRFFSAGSLPEDGVVDRGTTTKDIVDAAHRSQVYALPAVAGLDLRELGVRRYVMVTDEPGQPPRRLLGYERVPGRVRYFLDGRVYGDAARALLPEIAGYGAGLIDHLFRGELRLSIVEGDAGRVQVKPVARRGRVRGGKLRVFAEDDKGARREIGSFDASSGAPDVVTVAIPAGARRLAAVLRGQDDAGEVVAFGELAIPSRR